MNLETAIALANLLEPEVFFLSITEHSEENVASVDLKVSNDQVRGNQTPLVPRFCKKNYITTVRQTEQLQYFWRIPKDGGTSSEAGNRRLRVVE